MSDRYLILWPMAALAGLTFLVLGLVPLFRIADAFAGRVRADDFKLGESERVPDKTRLINRNYMNLLELPVLFYAACLIIFVTGNQTPLQLGIAWAFVGLRAVHTLVHLTVNIVLLRLPLFALSVFSLIVLWAVTFWRIARL